MVSSIFRRQLHRFFLLPVFAVMIVKASIYEKSSQIIVYLNVCENFRTYVILEVVIANSHRDLDGFELENFTS